ARAYWPSSDDRAEPEILIDTREGAVGLAPAEHITARVVWPSADRVRVSAARAEAELAWRHGKASGHGAVSSTLPVVGIDGLFRAIAILELESRGVVVVHAAAVRSGRDAVALLGASGAGKTTTARRLGREGFVRVADDMLAADLRQSPPALHPLPFER